MKRANIFLAFLLVAGCSESSDYIITNNTGEPLQITVYFTDRFAEDRELMAGPSGQDFLSIDGHWGEKLLAFQMEKDRFTAVLPPGKDLWLVVIASRGQPIVTHIGNIPEGRLGMSVAARLRNLGKSIKDVELEDLYYARIQFKWSGGEKEMSFTDFIKQSRCEPTFQSFNCRYVIQ
jgi:hypothetical protein